MKFAKLVFDGKSFNLPSELGIPREDQMQGTDLDKLTETSGRICYDSVGSGRNSTDYHKHIAEVGHGSVQEHGNITFSIFLDIPNYLSACEALLNRPGVWSTKEAPTLMMPNQTKGFLLRITANLRAIREWHEFPPANKMAILLGNQIQFLAHKESPLVLFDTKGEDMGMPLTVTKPKYEDEIWLSFLITNVSRGFSHELVRHKWRTAVSQRSTRYVDESESNWCWHPLILKYIKDKSNIEVVENTCKQSYKNLVNQLQSELIAQGTDKFTARKQARGAARGILGNALFTEMIFSASLSQWKWIITLRANAAADAEIREVSNEIYEILSEKYPEQFKNWAKKTCPDGLGYEVEEPKI